MKSFLFRFTSFEYSETVSHVVCRRWKRKNWKCFIHSQRLTVWREPVHIFGRRSWEIERLSLSWQWIVSQTKRQMNETFASAIYRSSWRWRPCFPQNLFQKIDCEKLNGVVLCTFPRVVKVQSFFRRCSGLNERLCRPSGVRVEPFVCQVEQWVILLMTSFLPKHWPRATLLPLFPVSISFAAFKFHWKSRAKDGSRDMCQSSRGLTKSNEIIC